MNRDVSSIPLKRITLDQLRLLVRRSDPESPMADSVIKTLDLLSQGVSPRVLEDHIARHTALALKIVAMAGSAAYGGTQIRSIRHAIELLGFDQLYSLVATLSLFANSPKRQLVEGIDRNQYQRRCLAIGLFSRTIATNMNLPSVESHYMAGLFIDCGYLSLGKFCGEKLSQVVAVCQRTQVDDLIEIERYYIGFDHTEAGMVLGEENHFSPEICAAIRHHHQPMFAPKEHQLYSDVSHVSSWLADEFGFSIFEAAPRQNLDSYAVKRLGIEPMDLEAKVIGIKQSAESTMNLVNPT